MTRSHESFPPRSPCWFLVLFLVLVTCSASLAETHPLYLNIICTHHQPMLLDPQHDQLLGPWARAHAIQEAYPTASLLREFQDIHATVQLSGPFIYQLKKYYLDRMLPFLKRAENRLDSLAFLQKWRGKTDPWIDLALKPSKNFDRRDMEFIRTGAWSCFSIPTSIISQFPQFYSLSFKSPDDYTIQDLTRIKCWALLALFPIDFFKGPRQLASGARIDLSDLIERKDSGSYWLRRSLTEDDANRLVVETLKVVEACVAIHNILGIRPGFTTGNIELITTPFTHPILPLIPEHAKFQVEQSLYYFEDVFDIRPSGMLMPEGVFSSAQLDLFREIGLSWIVGEGEFLMKATPQLVASDQLFRYSVENKGSDKDLVLAFSNSEFHSFKLKSSEETPDQAVERFFKFLSSKSRQSTRQLLILELDGPRIWNDYLQDPGGKRFLRQLFIKLKQEQKNGHIVTVTVQEFIQGNPERNVPPHPVKTLTNLVNFRSRVYLDKLQNRLGPIQESHPVLACLREAEKILKKYKLLSPIPGKNFLSEDAGENSSKTHHINQAWKFLYLAQSSHWFEFFQGKEPTTASWPPGTFLGQTSLQFQQMQNGFYNLIREVYRQCKLAGLDVTMPKF